MNKKEIKQAVKEFIKDPTKKKLELEVPDTFSIAWIQCPIMLGLRKLALLILSKTVPSNFKTWLFRMMGYDFGTDVCLPGFIDIGAEFPKLMTLREGVLVGGLSKIKTYTKEGNKVTIGRVDVGRRVLISGWAEIMPGATVGTNTILGLKSVTTEDIPEGSFVVGKNKVLKTWSAEELERHFGESMHDPDYPQKVKELMKQFRKDKSMQTVRFRNDGNRLNAGCDWWRGRPVWVIFFKGFFVELAQLCPFEWGRKLCFKIQGVKFGRNVKLGKKVMFDHIYGDMVNIGDNCVIEDGVFIDGHEYTTTETVYGKSKIGNNVHLKKGCYIREGLNIGDNAVIEENAVVLKDVGAGETWAGAPAKKVEL